MPQVHIVINYEWYPWTAWSELAPYARYRTRSPLPARPSVYEMRRADAEPDRLLFIGSRKNLAHRISHDQGLTVF